MFPGERILHFISLFFHISLLIPSDQILKAVFQLPKSWGKQPILAPSMLILVKVSGSSQTLGILRLSPLAIPKPDSCAGHGDTGLFLQDTTVHGSQILIRAF